MTKILLVEDDVNIIENLKELLKNEGFEVVTAMRQSQALDLLDEEKFDLILLDISLPDGSGYAICSAAKAATIDNKNKDVPIIFITAYDDEASAVTGLDMGAEDYITKPFNPLEVLARVKTQLRRYKKYNNTNEESDLKDVLEYEIRGLYINKKSHQCKLFGEDVKLTPIEFDILWYLCASEGQVVSSEELFQAVWKEAYFDNNNNTVMAHIGRLRDKLKEPHKKPRFIKTVWGVGYKIEK